MRNIFLLLVISALLWSCGEGNTKFPQVDIKIEPPEAIKVHRYGKALFELDTTQFKAGLESIQDEFMLFLDADLDNPENVRQLYEYAADTQLRRIYNKVTEVYPSLEVFENELTVAFSRYIYYFPEKPVPTVYTYVSDLYYEAPVVLAGSDLVVALDVYLGADFPLYMQLGLPFYKVRNMTPENLIVDVMKTVYLTELLPSSRSRTLLDRMIEGGKMLTFLDAVLPEVPDSIKINYTADKLHWAVTNEKNIWAYLIENNLLYSTDYQNQTLLIQDGPFTTGFSDESPSRLGIFIGWQIVLDFMKNNPEVSLNQLVEMTDSQAILQASGYKP